MGRKTSYFENKTMWKLLLGSVALSVAKLSNLQW